MDLEGFYWRIWTWIYLIDVWQYHVVLKYLTVQIACMTIIVDITHWPCNLLMQHIDFTQVYLISSTP